MKGWSYTLTSQGCTPGRVGIRSSRKIVILKNGVRMMAAMGLIAYWADILPTLAEGEMRSVIWKLPCLLPILRTARAQIKIMSVTKAMREKRRTRPV